MTQEIYNVLVIGKTGVGKSGFINYLFGKEVAKSDAGRPQTKEGFHEHTLKIQDLPSVNVFDSWGLEADKHEKWMELLNKELAKRGTSKPVQEWFHSVFYCIQASGHRVEPADVAIVNRLIEQKYPVTILLTKSDLVSEEDEKKMQKTVSQEFQGNVKAIPISIGAETRSGKTESFGREKVIASMKSNCYLGLANRLPLHLRDILDENLMLWKKEALHIITSVGYMDENKKLTELKNLSEKSKNILEKLKEKAFSTMKIYEKILIWTGKEISLKKYFPEQEKDLLWLLKVLPIFPSITFIAIAYGLIQGKSNNREKLQKAFEEDYSEIKSHCEKFITSFEFYLQKEAAKADA